VPWYVTLFSESASRAVVSVAAERAAALEGLAAEHGVPFARIGETGGPRMVFDTLFEVDVDEARAVYEGAIPALLAG
jgi:phosphoribosylformylglycinamidine synthase subunit PurL